MENDTDVGVEDYFGPFVINDSSAAVGMMNVY